ncbi:hypothetical protein FGB62_16g32 [Gracilaria domingensis]|nr:hypothetical protein FGB62_16g32 [Gracilaria domingensis]
MRLLPYVYEPSVFNTVSSTAQEDIESVRGSCSITFPRQDHPDLQRYSEISFGTRGIIKVARFDVYDNFSVLVRKKTLTWNLQRGSSIRNGIKRDGSFIGGTPVVLPQEVLKNFPNFEQHMKANEEWLQEQEENIKKFKARYNIPHIPGKGSSVNDWTPLEKDVVVNNENWEQYGTHELFPYMKAATNRSYFVLRNNREATIVRPIETIPNMYARVARLKALELFCLPTEHGVLVAAPLRFLLSLFWLLLSLCSGVVAAVHNRSDWVERMESFITVATVVGLTLPAFFSLLMQEPDLVKNAIRGKKTLTTDQQVATWFGFTELDYAAAAICLNGTFLVSEFRGRFLSGKANGALSGGGYLVSAATLQKVGILVGRSIYRRVWDDTNRIVEQVDSFVSHLSSLERKGKYRSWAAGCVETTLVG